MDTFNQRTNYPPLGKPMLIYDGNCAFCKFWLQVWMKNNGERFSYKSFQDVSADFKDIPRNQFEKAVQLIFQNGRVISGAEVAYFSSCSKEKSWLHRAYLNNYLFRLISDKLYHFIANNREVFFTLSKMLFGQNPNKLKPYWLIYIILTTISLWLIFN